jgi:hypothetical protein
MRTRVLSPVGLLFVFGALTACTSYGNPPPDTYVAPDGSIVEAPPDLPAYDQPPCPSDGYVWTPGYWAWDGAYYWVPGTWVQPPEVGVFWTPGYWGWGGAAYVWHEGYWGPHVGFYGGIDYGYGYSGHGYEGGRWDNGRFYYNQSVNNVNVTNIHNVYNTTVVNNTTIVNNTRVSYNGGNGGVNAGPTPDEQVAARDRHQGPVSAQADNVRAARSDPQLRASANQGKPPIAATPRAGDFNSGVVAAREAGAVHTAPAEHANNGSRGNNAVHPDDLPPLEHQAPSTGNAQLDHKYQQQQQKLEAQQNQDRVQLQKKQDQEHTRLNQQHADQAKQQQLEKQHQQQTQAMVQKHNQQWQNLKSHQQPPKDEHGKGKQ